MANFFPLIANAAANTIQELPAGSFLDLSQSGIANSGNITVSGAVSASGNITAGGATINGDLTVTGNAILSGNVVGDRIVNGTTSIEIPAPGSDATVSVAGNANVAVFTADGIVVAGNIVPTGNGVYSLGNATNQWESLYVSNTTIYIDNVPITLGAGNVLQVAGQPILSNDSNTSISTTGNITADFFIGDGSQLTNLPFDATKIQNGSSNVEIATANGNVTVTANGTAAWNFDTTGNLITPGNLLIGNIPSASGSSILQNDAPLQVVSEGANGFAVAGWAQTTSAGGNLAIIGFNSPVGGPGNVVISTGDNGNTQYNWNFDNTGNLTLPQGGTITEAPSPSFLGAAVTITPANTTDADQQLKIYPTFAEGNHLHLTTGNLYNTELYLGDDSLNIKLANTGDVVINSNDGLGNTAQWTFDSAGLLTAPGNISTTGNIVAGYFVGDGSQLTGLPASYGNANVATFLASYGSNNISTSGNIIAGNLTGNISITGNVTGTSANVTLVAGSYSAVFDNTGVATFPGELKGDILVSTNSAGDEGGEINLALPAANTTLGGLVTVDVYKNQFRIFEGGVNAKGYYMDLADAPNGAGGQISYKASGFVNAGTFVTLDNIKATVTTTPNYGLSLATTTGTISIDLSGFYNAGGGNGGGSFNGGTLNTSASTSQFNWNFTAQGDTSTYILTDTTNSRCYRITLMIGAGYNNNMISIERLA